MNFEIDKETLHRTTDCAKDFDCLNNNNHDYCKVLECVNTVHFVKCSMDNRCYYRLPFSKEFICTCPTRKEIFKKYKI